METILAITNSTNQSIKLIPYQSPDEALKGMKSTYEDLCRKNSYDYYNTYIDEELRYAQVVNGLETIELRIGKLIS